MREGWHSPPEWRPTYAQYNFSCLDIFRKFHDNRYSFSTDLGWISIIWSIFMSRFLVSAYKLGEGKVSRNCRKFGSLTCRNRQSVRLLPYPHSIKLNSDFEELMCAFTLRVDATPFRLKIQIIPGIDREFFKQKMTQAYSCFAFLLFSMERVYFY